MSETWVANASPLILLGKIRQVRLLYALPDELIVPQVVLNEVDVKPDGGRLQQELEAAPRARIESDVPVSAHVVAWDLGAGESGVLTHAAQGEGRRAVLDDRDARRCAQSLNVPVIGTLGVVLRAKRKGLVDAARPLIVELRQVGLFVTDDLVEAALKQVGEA